MKPFILFGLSFLAPFVGALPARDVVLKNETSCQTDGGGELGSIICKDTCIQQGNGWTGGYCDDQQICHCTF